MICPDCGSKARVRRVANYPYEGAGVPGVYFTNVKVISCKHCSSESPIVRNIKGVLVQLGELIAMQSTPLGGEQIRFLRKHAGCSARGWARLLGVDHAVVSRWENNKHKPSAQSDRLMRILYLLKLVERGEAVDSKRVLQCIEELERRGTFDPDVEFPIDISALNSRSGSAMPPHAMAC